MNESTVNERDTVSLESGQKTMVSKKETEELMPLLSVIVPVYNLADYIDTCIASLIGQTYQNLEIVIVDDGSTDGSAEKCDAWANMDTRIRVIHKENGGLSTARNTGLQMASGDWIGFVDGDDWIDAQMYETLISQCLEHDAEIGSCTFEYVYPDHTFSDGDSGNVCIMNHKEALEGLCLQKKIRFEVCTKVIKKNILADASFIPGQIYEDIHFTRLIMRKLTHYLYLERAFYHYRQNREGNTNSRFPIQKLAIIEELDDFCKELSEEGLEQAAQGLRAFTLDHLIRMYVNAKDCGVEKRILQWIREAYRSHYPKKQTNNGSVKRVRGWIFYVSPTVYDWLSQRLHSRSHKRKTIKTKAHFERSL
ncbi:MAG: glycosyltransferase [Clostridia bacterium]